MSRSIFHLHSDIDLYHSPGSLLFEATALSGSALLQVGQPELSAHCEFSHVHSEKTLLYFALKLSVPEVLLSDCLSDICSWALGKQQLSEAHR